MTSLLFDNDSSSNNSSNKDDSELEKAILLSLNDNDNNSNNNILINFNNLSINEEEKESKYDNTALITGINKINKRSFNDEDEENEFKYNEYEDDNLSIYTASSNEELSNVLDFIEDNDEEYIGKKWPGDCPSKSEILDLINTNLLNDIEKARMYTFIKFIEEYKNYNKLLDEYKRLKSNIKNNDKNNIFTKEAIEYGNYMRRTFPSGDGPYEEMYMKKNISEI